jgi:hypothetical protein
LSNSRTAADGAALLETFGGRSQHRRCAPGGENFIDLAKPCGKSVAPTPIPIRPVESRPLSPRPATHWYTVGLVEGKWPQANKTECCKPDTNAHSCGVVPFRPSTLRGAAITSPIPFAGAGMRQAQFGRCGASAQGRPGSLQPTQTTCLHCCPEMRHRQNIPLAKKFKPSRQTLAKILTIRMV